MEGGMLAVDAGPEPVAKEEVELLLDPILFGCRCRTGRSKLKRLSPPKPGAGGKVLVVALKYYIR